ncbi:MAG: hypothetical protein U0798_09785 [Gemmataceae bacterium]
MKRVVITLTLLIMSVPLAHAQTEAIQKEVEERLKSLRADDTELKRILANHPDVLVAKAKVQLANEELSKIERNLTVRYLSLIKGYEFTKQGYNQLNLIKERMVKLGAAGSTLDMSQLDIQINRFAESLLKQEAELNEIIFHGQQKLQKNQDEKEVRFSGIISNRLSKEMLIEPGSMLDKLKVMIDQPVEYKCNKLPAVDALEGVQNKLGAKVLVRMNDLSSLRTPLTVTAEGKMAFSSWVEMIVDDCNSQAAMIGQIGDGKKPVFDAYVRDYGVLITYTFKRPQDAITLREFTAMVRAEKAKTTPKK